MGCHATRWPATGGRVWTEVAARRRPFAKHGRLARRRHPQCPAGPGSAGQAALTRPSHRTVTGTRDDVSVGRRRDDAVAPRRAADWCAHACQANAVRPGRTAWRRMGLADRMNWTAARLGRTYRAGRAPRPTPAAGRPGPGAGLTRASEGGSTRTSVHSLVTGFPAVRFYVLITACFSSAALPVPGQASRPGQLRMRSRPAVAARAQRCQPRTTQGLPSQVSYRSAAGLRHPDSATRKREDSED